MDEKERTIYDSENNSWNLAIKAPVTMQKKAGIAVMCNGKLYVGGLKNFIDFWEYSF